MLKMQIFSGELHRLFGAFSFIMKSLCFIAYNEIITNIPSKYMTIPPRYDCYSNQETDTHWQSPNTWHIVLVQQRLEFTAILS